MSTSEYRAEVQPSAQKWTLGKHSLLWYTPGDNHQHHWKSSFFPARWSHLEGSLCDPKIPSTRGWSLLRQRILPMFWGRCDPAWASVAVRPLTRPFWSQTSVSWHWAPLWHCGRADWESHRRAPQDTDSSTRAALPVQHHLEAMAAALLWDIPFLLVW